jgi:amino acid transporter
VVLPVKRVQRDSRLKLISLDDGSILGSTLECIRRHYGLVVYHPSHENILTVPLICRFVVMITVVACAPTHQNSEFVFRTWINNTGWENQVICFITGLVNPLYSLGGLDGVTHLTEEMPNPSRNAPLAIAITLAIAFVTGITYLVALMFSVQDYAALSSTNTGLPLAELFRQVTKQAGGAFGLTFILFIALGPCVISSQLSTGRMFWAFSRDGALPFSDTWAKVNHRLQMPMNAQLAVTAIVAALGCLYLGSSTAFNSLLGSAVTINNCAYLVPILTNLLTGRRNMYKGVFHMSGYTGFIVNIVTVCWLAFAIVFFSFPYYKPVTGKSWITCGDARYANLNYSCEHELYMFSGWWTHVVPTVVVHQSKRPLQRAHPKSKRRMMLPDEWSSRLTEPSMEVSVTNIFDNILYYKLWLAPSQSLFLLTDRCLLTESRSELELEIIIYSVVHVFV